MVVSGNGWLACKNRYQKSYWKSNYNPNRTSNPNNWYRSSVKQLTYQIRLIGRDILWAINTISLALWQDIIASLSYPPLEGDEIWDPGFLGDSEMWQRAETQELRLQHFESRWEKEFPKYLSEFHKVSEKNEPSVQVGGVVLVNSDYSNVQWRMAVLGNLENQSC